MPKKKSLPAKHHNGRNGQDPRWEKALSYLLDGKTAIESCQLAGFGSTFAVTGGPQKLKRMGLSKGQEILDSYKGQALLNLAPIGESERQLVAHLAKEGNYQELPKFANVLKQIKQAAGALAQDQEQTQTLIQIADLKVLIQQSVPSLAPPRSVPMIENKEQVGYRVGKQKDMNDKPSKHKVL